MERSTVNMLNPRSVQRMSVTQLFTQKTQLHSMLYLVSDKPGKSNLSTSVPLVGTKSYKTLLNWLADMDVDISRVRMYNQIDHPFEGMSGLSLNNAIKAKHIKVVALGEAAKKYLLRANINEFFVLPHPSPKNRSLNDKKFVKQTLEQCRSYIYG